MARSAGLPSAGTVASHGRNIHRVEELPLQCSARFVLALPTVLFSYCPFFLSFQRLPPGCYRLRVEVGVDDDQWTPGLELAITQQPHWWQRPGVWLMAVLVAVFITLVLVRWRLASLRERNRRLEMLVVQRSDELASERVAVAEAQAAQVEAERQLRWLRRHRALEEWAEVDATARSVFAVLQRVTEPARPAEILAQLQAASVQTAVSGRWPRWRPRSIGCAPGRR